MQNCWTLAAVAAVLVMGTLSALAQTTITYRCKDGSEVPVAFFEGDRRAHLQLDGKALALPRRVAVGGARYAKSGVTLRIKGELATLRRGGRTTECRAE